MSEKNVSVHFDGIVWTHGKQKSTRPTFFQNVQILEFIRHNLSYFTWILNLRPLYYTTECAFILTSSRPLNDECYYLTFCFNISHLHFIEEENSIVVATCTQYSEGHSIFVCWRWIWQMYPQGVGTTQKPRQRVSAQLRRGFTLNSSCYTQIFEYQLVKLNYSHRKYITYLTTNLNTYTYIIKTN